MPNPLLGAFQWNISKRKNAVGYGDPDPKKKGIEPIPEEYEGENNPYRGIERHGVAPTEEANPFTGFEGDQVGLATLPVVREMDPIPVYDVTRFGRERRDWKNSNVVLNEQRSHQLVPQNDTRSSLIIRNSGPNTLYISPDSSVQPSTGFPVDSGATFSMNAQTAVYGTVTTGESATVRMVWEHAVDLPGRD